MSDLLERIEKLPPKKLALLALQLQNRVETLERARREPIAIVGIGCRFPGGGDGPDAFWRLLREGRDAISEVPKTRWDIDTLYDPDPDTPGRMSTRFGGFLEGVDQFDPQFFGIAPREAQTMDPQQRLLLEVAWEALEHAGLSPDRLQGSRTGVFVGISGHDYFMDLMSAADPALRDMYLATGGAHSVASGRISYVLGLHGPSLSVDTACSSSLVAVHLACQSLRTEGCRTALAGGVNLVLSPDITMTLSRARMMAPDGRCKTFDARGDGYVRGEGCGLLVLKRLTDALADGDDVLAVIRGSAVNQDGKSSGLTAPNGVAQEDVIRQALADADLPAGRVEYVETHGTGTSLGDPIEVRALGATLAVGRPRSAPLLIGSVKTNVGHLESASGVAGLIKLVLCLQHGEIAPHLHLREPNPHIPWSELAIMVPTKVTPWQRGSAPRVGAVSSFGFSGTNAHFVIEEAPAPEERTASGPERPLHLLALSARSDESLRALAGRYARRLQEKPDLALADVCFTAAVGRAHLPQRLAVRVATREAAVEALDGLARGDAPAGSCTGRAPGSGSPRVAFLYTGQGSQWGGMGRELYETQPTFRRALERCAELLGPQLERPLLEVMFEAGNALDETQYTQPALFALEWSLSELWRSFGVRPTWVMGHSVGEYVAACVAGAYSLEEGLRLIAARGRLMGALARDGAMVSVLASEGRVEEVVGRYGGEVSVAAVNGPQSVVISGRRAAVESAARELEQSGARTRPLAVSHAFHSALLEPMLGEFERLASQVQYRAPELGVVSNLTGGVLGAGELGGSYWRRHARERVRFKQGMEVLREQGCAVFVELGPSPVLLGMGRECIAEGAWVPTLRKGRRDWEQLLDAVGELYVRGVDLDWKGFDSDYSRRKVALPSYPFQRQRYWLAEEDTARRAASTTPAAPDAIDGWLYEPRWEPVATAGSPHVLAGGQPLATLADGVDERLPAIAREQGLDRYDALLPELEATCGQFMLKGLRTIGFPSQAGERITPAATLSRLGIADTHARLVRHLFGVLEDDGILRRDGEQWEVLRPIPECDPAARLVALKRTFPQHGPELTAAGRCGEAFADVLRGRADVLQILFPGGSLDLAEGLYRDAPAATAFARVVQDALGEFLAGVLLDRALRVVEIGAGTGALTSRVLPVLPDGTEYWFTDVSRLFVAKAREKFRDRPLVRCETLDIERDPAAQGFAPRSFDVVLAANVLHATADLRETLRQVRRLLAPGGLLVLLEATVPTRFSDLIVGPTEGWWRFRDVELRPSYALLASEQWGALLREQGFAEVAALPSTPRRQGILAQQAVLLARESADPADVSSPSPTGSWLVVGGSGDLSRRLTQRIEERGGRCLVVPRAGATSSAQVESALAQLGTPARGVVYLADDAPTPNESTSPGEMLASQQALCGGALLLAQALARRVGADAPRLWFVTRGAQPVVDGPLALSASTLWGLGRVVALEHPELRCKRLDLDPRVPEDEPGALLSELLADDAEDQAAFRDGGRQVLRLARSRPPMSRLPALRGDASYLVTGGLRGLGLLVAEWLVDRGARHLVLVGRREPDDDCRSRIARLAARGVRVVVEQGDVSLEETVRGILERLSGALPPLAGVIHSAGVLDDGVLLQQDWDRFARVMAPKVEGAWALHRATAGLPLDYFVLFSSGAALFGSPGQANHAAANAFLDALAHHRRAQGLAGQSINWGVWSEVGAAAERGIEERLRGSGMLPFSPRDGLRALGRLMSDNPAQVAVTPIDWTRLAGGASAASPFLAGLLSSAQSVAAQRGPQTRAGLRESLEAVAPARRWSILRRQVSEQAVAVLGLDPSRALEEDRPLHELGLDSLMAVDLRNRLGRLVEASLPATLVFDHPTVERLAAFLGREVLQLERSEVRAEAEPASGNAPGADDLTSDEMARLLERRLDALESDGGPR